VLGVGHDQRVDFFLVSDGHAEEVFGKAAHLGLDLVGGFPEIGAHLLRRLLADVRLKEHLHGQLARFAAPRRVMDSSGQRGPPGWSLRLRLTISMAAVAASKPLLPALMPARLRACSKVSQVRHAKAVGNAGLLLRLSKAARYFVVDGFVMGGLAAQQTAEGDDGVHPARICNGASGGWNLPCAGNTDHINVSAFCAAAQQSVERALKKPLGDHCIPAATTTANFMPVAQRSPSTATGLPLTGSVHARS